MAEETLLTTIQLAKRLAADDVAHLRAQTINGWVGRPGYPQPERVSERRGQAHLWRYAAVLKWFADNGNKQTAPQLDEHTSRRRKLAAEARLAELELATKNGEFIRRSDIVRDFSQLVIAARTRFLEIPSKLAPQLAAEKDPVVCQAIIDGAISEALEELGNYGTRPQKAVRRHSAPKQ
jgi:phage terminase Nu1 subunit (DNA packaging protein)